MLKSNPNLIVESWPDEVIILDLTKGLYYSLRGSARIAWPLLAHGIDKQELIQTLQTYYVGDVQEPIEILLNQMQQEEIVIESHEKGQPLPEKSIPMGKIAFELPIFQVFREMQDLLLLDPIHDTNEAGWPHRPT